MPLSDRAASLMFAFGGIESAVARRAGTAEVYQAIRDSYTAQGLSVPPLPMAAVNELRSYATGMRNSAEALAKADPSGSVLSDYIARTPWSRDLADQAATPEYQVRFQHTVTDEAGNELSEWRSVIFPGALPATIDALMDEVEAGAEAMAEEYGTTHGGISGLQILAR